MDTMSVLELPDFVNQHWNELYIQLRTGRYVPKPVRRVVIPKPDGGERNLGVPTVLDRMIQQATAQILTKIYEPKFSERSFGFRPGRSAHDAIDTLRRDCDEGYTWAVDIDLSKYFDTINHDILMNILRRDIKDETVLVLIKRFLKSGVLIDGVVNETETGSPQGGNLSPLLANIYLNEYDTVLEERGHRFVRYADDLMVLMKSRKGAERVMESSRNYLEKVLKLKVNSEKSIVAPVVGLKYLGFSLYRRKEAYSILIHPKTVKRFKDRVRQIFRKNTPIPIEDTLRNLTVFFRGWVNYFGLADIWKYVDKVSAWARRKLRAKMLKQWKKSYRRFLNLRKALSGVKEYWYKLNYGKLWASLKFDGIWKMSNNPQVKHALNNRYLMSLGFPDMLKMYEEAHSRLLNRRDTRVRPVV